MRLSKSNAPLPSTKPILKWAGGKSQLLPVLRKLIPRDFKRYVEPFLGGGALFFDLARPGSLISDSNRELMLFYEIVRDDPDGLFEEVSSLPVSRSEFYRVRAMNPDTLAAKKRAARFLYLNKTCFNGLHRVNKRGEFNTPFCGRTDIKVIQRSSLRKASELLKTCTLVCSDFEQVFSSLRKGDFIYIDPPYWPLPGYSDFKRYTQEFFNISDHFRLAKFFDRLSEKGIPALLSNSHTPEILKLYKKFAVVNVEASRCINSKASKRGKILEVIIANYPLENRHAISRYQVHGQ